MQSGGGICFAAFFCARGRASFSSVRLKHAGWPACWGLMDISHPLRNAYIIPLLTGGISHSVLVDKTANVIEDVIKSDESPIHITTEVTTSPRRFTPLTENVPVCTKEGIIPTADNPASTTQAKPARTKTIATVFKTNLLLKSTGVLVDCS